MAFIAFPDGGMITCVKDDYPPPLPACPAGYGPHAPGTWTTQPPDRQNNTVATCAAKCTAAACVAFSLSGASTNYSQCSVWVGSVSPLDWTPEPETGLAAMRTCMKAGYTPPPPPPPLHDMKILTSYGGTADQLHGTVNVITADCCGGKLDACTNDTITGTFGMKVLLNVPTPSNRFSIRDNCWRKPGHSLEDDMKECLSGAGRESDRPMWRRPRQLHRQHLVRHN